MTNPDDEAVATRVIIDVTVSSGWLDRLSAEPGRRIQQSGLAHQRLLFE